MRPNHPGLVAVEALRYREVFGLDAKPPLRKTVRGLPLSMWVLDDAGGYCHSSSKHSLPNLKSLGHTERLSFTPDSDGVWVLETQDGRAGLALLDPRHLPIPAAKAVVFLPTTDRLVVARKDRMQAIAHGASVAADLDSRYKNIDCVSAVPLVWAGGSWQKWSGSSSRAIQTALEEVENEVQRCMAATLLDELMTLRGAGPHLDLIRTTFRRGPEPFTFWRQRALQLPITSEHIVAREQTVEIDGNGLRMSLDWSLFVSRAGRRLVPLQIDGVSIRDVFLLRPTLGEHEFEDVARESRLLQWISKAGFEAHIQGRDTFRFRREYLAYIRKTNPHLLSPSSSLEDSSLQSEARASVQAFLRRFRPTPVDL